MKIEKASIENDVFVTGDGNRYVNERDALIHEASIKFNDIEKLEIPNCPTKYYIVQNEGEKDTISDFLIQGVGYFYKLEGPNICDMNYPFVLEYNEESGAYRVITDVVVTVFKKIVSFYE